MAIKFPELVQKVLPYNTSVPRMPEVFQRGLASVNGDPSTQLKVYWGVWGAFAVAAIGVTFPVWGWAWFVALRLYAGFAFLAIVGKEAVAALRRQAPGQSLGHNFAFLVSFLVVASIRFNLSQLWRAVLAVINMVKTLSYAPLADSVFTWPAFWLCVGIRRGARLSLTNKLALAIPVIVLILAVHFGNPALALKLHL